MGPNLLDKNYVNDFAEFILNQLVIHDVQYFCRKSTVFPARISLGINEIWVGVLLNHFLKYWNLALSKDSALPTNVKKIFHCNS
jgi:hypothetical protein